MTQVYSFPRIDDDVINVTMEEFCKIKDEMEGGNSHKMSFDEDSIRCQKVCEILGVEMAKMVNHQWRVVVVSAIKNEE